MRIIKTQNLSSDTPLDFTDQLLVYNGLDACITYEILDKLLTQLRPETSATYDFSRSLQGVILEMNTRGLRVDEERRQSLLMQYSAESMQLVDQLNRIIREGVGFQYEITAARKNPWPSDAQLCKLFYDYMGIPAIFKLTDEGERRLTVDRKALEKLEGYFYAEPIVRHLYTLREHGKKMSFLNSAIDGDGRLRTNFNIAGTTTGRLASSFSDFGTGTNLQNVENRLRSIFIADPGYKFCNIDLEQSDARVCGAIHWNLFRDARYLELCESGDLHTGVSRIAFPNIPWTGEREADRILAGQRFYRDFSYRDASKRLGHGCLTEAHEVLTRDGWKQITEKPAEILIWSLEKSYFSTVSHWEDKQYNGEFVTFKGISIDAEMTADHRVPYLKDRLSPFIYEKPAHERPGRYLPLGNDYVGGIKKVPARLIAAFMADGSQAGNRARFHLIKRRKIDRLEKLCVEYGFRFRIDGKQDTYSFEASFPKYPGPYILNWTKECISDFIDELKYWDGHISDTAISISSTRKQDLEWFQTLARIIGKGGNIGKPYGSFGSIVYRLQQNNRIFADGASIKVTKFIGNKRVLCPTVETSWFYVRHNGKIFVTGNTNYQGEPPKMSRETHIPVGDIERFQRAYLPNFAFERWWEWVDQQVKSSGVITTMLGRRRKFFGHPKDHDTIRAAIAYEPQSVTADTINRGMLAVWLADRVQLLLQVHDSILFQFPEEQEDEIVPWALGLVQQLVMLKGGREFMIPAEAKVGWNWSDDRNDPDALRKWPEKETRKRVRG